MGIIRPIMISFEEVSDVFETDMPAVTYPLYSECLSPVQSIPVHATR